jgi:molybdate transport system regulatory protein
VKDSPVSTHTRKALAQPGQTGAAAARTNMEVRSKLWIEVGGKTVLGGWRVAILEGIERTGSLAKAAEELGTPYRTAWQRLKESEENLGIRLVETQSGGVDGGGSSLTPAARDLLQRYNEFSKGLEELVNQRFHEAFG